MEETSKNGRRQKLDKNIAEADNDCILKPKVKRTPAQDAAFIKARETRALNIKKRQELRELKEDVKVEKQTKAYDKVAVRHERAARVAAKVELLKETKTKLQNRKKIVPPTFSSESSSESNDIEEYSVSEESSSSEEEIIAKPTKHRVTKSVSSRTKPVSRKPVQKIAPPKKPKKVVYHYESSSSDEMDDEYRYEEVASQYAKQYAKPPLLAPVPNATSSYLGFFK